jgi:chemotaxis protein CheX
MRVKDFSMFEQSHISPFITSIQNVFSTMLQLPVEIGEPHIKTDDSVTHDVSGIIALSGEMQGTIVMSMPQDAAVSIINLFTGESLSPHTHEFADALGELVNMISGNAKAEFQLKCVSISCPSVVIGSHHRISPPPGSACVCIPCMTDCGEITLEISVCESTRNEQDSDINNAA